MSNRFHDVLVEAADLAPPTQPDPDELWMRARRANRVGRAVTAAVVVVLCLLGGLAIKDTVVHDTQPTDSPGSLGFPDDLYDIPSRTATTDDAGPLGPLAFVSIGQAQGFWPWSAKEAQVYGVSAATGEYRFLSLPGLDIRSGIDAGTVALSPDGRRVAYPFQESAEHPSEALAVYDTVTGDISKYSTDFESGSGIGWVTWSPDSTRLAAGILKRSPVGNEGDFSSSPEVIALYDVAADEFTERPDNLIATEFGDVSWKPKGTASPGGLTVATNRGLAIYDPDSTKVSARYPVPQPSNFQTKMTWTSDGDTFAVVDARCANTCEADQQRMYAITLNAEGDPVTVRSAGPRDKVAFAVGWMGPTGADPLLSFDFSSPPELVESDGEELTVRPISATSDSGARFWAAADVLATGKFKDAKEPRRPWGWDMALALVVLGLYLVRFVIGIRSQYAVRPVTATWFDVLKSVWREDGVAALSLVPALSITAALVVRQPGWVDPVSIVAVMLLTWWTMKRSPGGYGLLITWIVGYTAATALWRLDNWQDSAMIVVIGLVQLACLRAPGTQDLIGRGSPGQTDLGWGSSPYGPGIIHSPGPGDNLTG